MNAMPHPEQDPQRETGTDEDAERSDPHTGFTLRTDNCVGCGMCVLACSSIKQDVFSFSTTHAFVDVRMLEEEAADGQREAPRFDVGFTTECDGCSYCLGFCGFGAIEEPENWEKPEHLEDIRQRHLAERRARNKRLRQ